MLFSEWADPGHIRDQDNKEMLIRHLSHSIRMAETSFICDIKDSESLKIPEDNHRHKVFFKISVAVIIMLVMGLIGCMVWMKVLQKNCQHNCSPDCQTFNATVTFDGKNINFKAPRNGTYLIYGKVNKQGIVSICDEFFSLLQTQEKETEEITRRNLSQHEFVEFVELKEGAELAIRLNCDETQIDEENSFLKIYRINI